MFGGACGNRTRVPRLTTGQRWHRRQVAIRKNPKVVLEVRAKLKERGIACTGENLKQVLSKAELQRLNSSLHSAMSEGKKAEYKLLKNDDERRNFLAAYALDPQDFRGSCQTSLAATNSSTDKSIGQWVTQKQLGGPLFLNDEIAAATLIESGELPEQEHESPSLAKLGYKQYWWTHGQKIKNTGTEDKTEITGSGSMTKDEFDSAATYMRQGMDEMQPKKKPKAMPKPEEPPEVQERKVAITERGKALQTLKVAFTKYRKEVQEHMGYTVAIEQKDYPAEFVGFIRDKIDKLKKEVETAATYYAAQLIDQTSTTMEVHGIREIIKEIKDKSESLDSMMVSARKSTLKDAKRLGKE